MTLEQAKAELEKFVKLKTTMRPAFVDVLLEAEPVRHGKWRKVDYQIFVGKGTFVDALECSLCEEPNYEMSNYCPRCGARMDKE